MQIFLNGESHEIKEEMPLEKLIPLLGLAPQGIAVSCDEKIVPKSKWSLFIVKDGMKLDIYNMVAGG